MARKSHRRQRKRKNRRTRKKRGGGECLDWTKYKSHPSLGTDLPTHGDLVERLYCHVIRPTFSDKSSMGGNNPYHHVKIEQMSEGSNAAKALRKEAKEAKAKYDANPQDADAKSVYKEKTRIYHQKKQELANAWRILPRGESGETLGTHNHFTDDYFSPKNSKSWNEWLERLRPWILVFNYKMAAGDNRTNLDAQMDGKNSSVANEIFDRFVFHRDEIAPKMSKFFKGSGNTDGIANNELSDEHLLIRVNRIFSPKEEKKYVNPNTKDAKSLCHNIKSILETRRGIAHPTSGDSLCDDPSSSKSEREKKKCEESQELMEDNLGGLRYNKKGKMDPYTTCNLDSWKPKGTQVTGLLESEKQRWNLRAPVKKLSIPGNPQGDDAETFQKEIIKEITQIFTDKLNKPGRVTSTKSKHKGKSIEYHFVAKRLNRDWLKEKIYAAKDLEGYPVVNDPLKCRDPGMNKIYGGPTKCKQEMNRQFNEILLGISALDDAKLKELKRPRSVLLENKHSKIFLPIEGVDQMLNAISDRAKREKFKQALKSVHREKILHKLNHIKIGIKTPHGTKSDLEYIFYFEGVKGGRKTRRKKRRKSRRKSRKKRRKSRRKRKRSRRRRRHR